MLGHCTRMLISLVLQAAANQCAGQSIRRHRVLTRSVVSTIRTNIQADMHIEHPGGPKIILKYAVCFHSRCRWTKGVANDV